MDDYFEKFAKGGMDTKQLLTSYISDLTGVEIDLDSEVPVKIDSSVSVIERDLEEDRKRLDKFLKLSDSQVENVMNGEFVFSVQSYTSHLNEVAKENNRILDLITKIEKLEVEKELVEVKDSMVRSLVSKLRTLRNFVGEKQSVDDYRNSKIKALEKAIEISEKEIELRTKDAEERETIANNALKMARNLEELFKK